MKKTPFVTLQAHITWMLRGKIYDMDRVLEDLLKGEKFFIQIDGRRKQITVRGVANQGFNGQVLFGAYKGETRIEYRHIAIEKLPKSFQTKMIKKFSAK